MKKLFFLVVTLATSIFLSSQTASAPSSSDIGEELPDTVTQSFDLVSNCFPDGILPGVFSVSADKQVQFSRGNLQYTQSTNTWSFAAQQYEFIGTDNVTGGSVSHGATNGDHKSGTALADKIDLFGWSGSTATAKWGISTSDYYEDYSGDFKDWGKNPISNGGNKANQWRSLTDEEWYYLCYTRANASTLKGVARINLNANGSEYANGLILLPDNWVCPAGVTFKSGFASSYSVQAYATYQTLTLNQWQALEQSGAVFLPAVGFRRGTLVQCVGGESRYWSATPYDYRIAWCLRLFFSVSFGTFNNYRSHGSAVRLIQDVK